MPRIASPSVLAALVSSRSSAGLLVRRLLPVTVLLPVLVGALRLEGESAGLYSATVGHAIMITFGVVAGTGALLWTAASAERIDHERRRAEEALRRSREQHRALAGSFPDGAVVLFDRELRHLIAAGQGLADVGLSSAAMEGRTIWDVFPPDVCYAIERPYRAALGGADSTFEYSYRDRTYLVRVVPVRDERSGEIRSGAATVRDVTEQKRAEGERDRLQADLLHAGKLEAIGQLAGGVAHEFNNTLMAITGHSGLLLERLEPDSPLRRDVEQIVGSAERAAALTRELLAFGRKQVLQPTTIDVNEVARAAVRLLQPLIDPGIELATSLDPELPTTAADPARIEQVLVNLVLNARDAISGGGRITIATRRALVGEPTAFREGVAAGEYLVLSVADTGSGMDEETRARIFEPFFTTKPAGKGSGLGLSTAYGIVRQGGGFVTVRSEPGRGTTIDVFLARRAAELETRAPARAAREPAAYRGSAVVVDDDEAVRTVCARLLGGLGYRVEAAAGGVEALALLAAAPGGVDLLLTDVVMPDLGGPELAARARALHPETTVVYMSGYPGDARRLADGLAGGARFLQKPFAATALERVLEARPPLAVVPPRAAEADGPTCVVADDHPAVLDAACRYLEERAIRVLARCSEAPAALEQVARLRPDVAVVDVSMPGLGGVEAARRLRERAPATRVLLYTGHVRPGLVEEALSVGARGVVLKSSPLSELARAIRIAAAAGLYVDPLLAPAPAVGPAVGTAVGPAVGTGVGPAVGTGVGTGAGSAVGTGAGAPVAGGQPPREEILTAREREVLRLLAEGQTNEQVGRTLSISPDTAQTHVRNAMKKLGAESRTQAVATAMRQALIS